MEIVSSKLEMMGLVASTRVERKDTSPHRWNAGTTATSHSTGATSTSMASRSSSTRKREALVPDSGKSLFSLRTYFRKLRVFKGTVKALINLRRFPVLTKAATGIGADAADQKQDRLSQRRPTAMIARISTDDDALQAVQSQVKSLVEEGHVITEIDSEQGDEVTYRLQGDLEHYTEDNLRKRAALETHPHMIALTQRLWLSAVQDNEENLSFPEYEAFMLRLHRLILPEFDLNGSKELIHDDWNRDANGADHLDYRFFHLSMFELVDLWTDTVDSEDYISLLYCIMHSLTFAWNAKYILKPLEDICPVNILEESKAVLMEEIARDLETEVNSEAAQLYRDRLKLPEDHQCEGDDDNNSSGSGEKMQSPSEEEVTVVDETSTVLPEATSSRDEGGLIDPAQGTHTEPRVASSPLPTESEETRSSTEATQRDPKRPRSSDATMRKKSASRASSSTLENDRKLQRLASATSRQQKNLGIESAALKASVVFDPFADLHVNSNSAGTGGSGHLNVQGRQNFQGNAGALKRGSVSNPFGNNNGVVLSIGTTDGSDFVNMVSRPSFVAKPSAITSMLNRSSAGAGINWHDFYQDASGSSENNSREFGVSGQEVLRGNKFDFGRIDKQMQPNGSLSPRKSTGGVSGGSLSTSEYLRINQAYAAAQLEKREQQLLNSALKVNEQQDGVSTSGDSIAGSNPSFSVISTPISPRSRSATYKRPSSQSQSHRTSTSGTTAQYDYTQQLKMDGTRVSDSRSGVRLGSLSVNAASISPSNDNHFADHIGTPPQQYQQQLSPRSHRIHSQQQQQQSRTSSSPLRLADGLQGLTITSAQPLTSSSIPGSSSSSSPAQVRSPRRSADGASLIISSSSMASAVLDQGSSANSFSSSSPRPGLGLASLHSNVTTVSVVPPWRQPPSPRKMSNHHSHQGSASSRRSLLADGSKWIQHQQQQQFGVGLGQISVQSVPISPRKP